MQDNETVWSNPPSFATFASFLLSNTLFSVGKCQREDHTHSHARTHTHQSTRTHLHTHIHSLTRVHVEKSHWQWFEHLKHRRRRRRRKKESFNLCGKQTHLCIMKKKPQNKFELIRYTTPAFTHTHTHNLIHN